MKSKTNQCSHDEQNWDNCKRCKAAWDLAVRKAEKSFEKYVSNKYLGTIITVSMSKVNAIYPKLRMGRVDLYKHLDFLSMDEIYGAEVIRLISRNGRESRVIKDRYLIGGKK
jgi:hypothetical protein